jgi:hypothetical protein
MMGYQSFYFEEIIVAQHSEAINSLPMVNPFSMANVTTPWAAYPRLVSKL